MTQHKAIELETLAFTNIISSLSVAIMATRAFGAIDYRKHDVVSYCEQQCVIKTGLNLIVAWQSQISRLSLESAHKFNEADLRHFQAFIKELQP